MSTYLSTLAASDPHFRTIALEELEDSIEWLRTRRNPAILSFEARVVAILEVLETSASEVFLDSCKDLLIQIQEKRRAWSKDLVGLRQAHEETWGPLTVEEKDLLGEAMVEAMSMLWVTGGGEGLGKR